MEFESCMEAITCVLPRKTVQGNRNEHHLKTDAEKSEMGMTAIDDSPASLIARLSGSGRGRGPLKVTAVQMIRIAANVRPKAACITTTVQTLSVRTTCLHTALTAMGHKHTCATYGSNSQCAPLKPQEREHDGGDSEQLHGLALPT